MHPIDYRPEQRYECHRNIGWQPKQADPAMERFLALSARYLGLAEKTLTEVTHRRRQIRYQPHNH